MFNKKPSPGAQRNTFRCGGKCRWLHFHVDHFLSLLLGEGVSAQARQMRVTRNKKIIYLLIRNAFFYTGCSETIRDVQAYTTVNIEPCGVFSTSIRLGKASFNSSRCVITSIFSKSSRTKLIASTSRCLPCAS